MLTHKCVPFTQYAVSISEINPKKADDHLDGETAEKDDEREQCESDNRQDDLESQAQLTTWGRLHQGDYEAKKRYIRSLVMT